MRQLSVLSTAVLFLLASYVLGSGSADTLYKAHVSAIKSAMLGSIRTSWEQGVASAAIIEIDNPEYSVFAETPFRFNGKVPVPVLQLALSAVVRQSADGRLSQIVNGDQDGAALDGASSGPAVLLGAYTDRNRTSFWQKAADAQLSYVLNDVPRTSTGAISHRAAEKQYWADGVYVGFPYIAAYGAATNNQTLLRVAYDQCRLYRDALLIGGPTGKLWAHIYSDDAKQFFDEGLWATGNGWAALGMLRIQATIMNTPFAANMKSEVQDLNAWIKEILDGTFAALTPGNLVPDYIVGGATFGDAASSAALASVAFRAAKLHPETFGANYTNTATKIARAVLANVDNLGTVSPYVDPLNWGQIGLLSTEGQAFALMMLAAWKDWAS